MSPDQRSKVLASLLEVAIGIEAGAGGRKKHHLAGAGVGSGGSNRVVKIGLAGDLNLRYFQVSIAAAS